MKSTLELRKGDFIEYEDGKHTYSGKVLEFVGKNGNKKAKVEICLTIKKSEPIEVDVIEVELNKIIKKKIKNLEY